MEEYVILVDEKDIRVGTQEKMAAHRAGNLHRAFSIFIFNNKKELMLQQRALTKYHSGGLWTNTCCSHPRPDETVLQACHRRLKEEMGFDTELKELFSFVYKTPLDNELTEHEFDHVVVGNYNNPPALNPEEAADFKWISLDNLETEIKNRPEEYSYWLKVSFGELLKHRESL